MKCLQLRIFFVYLGLGLSSVVTAASELPAKPIKTKTLKDIGITIERSAPATVESLNSSVIASEINARIIDMPILIGDVVNAGEVLVKLDCNDYVRNIKQARAQLTALKARHKLAKQQLDRLSKLVSSRSVSEDQINQKQSELDVTSAEIAAQNSTYAITQDQAAKCEVKSPFRGVVVERLGQIGGYATPGFSLLKITDLENLELTTEIPTELVAEIHQTTNFVFEFQNQRFPLHTPRLVPVINPATRTQEARTTFSAQHPTVGASGRMRWLAPAPAIPAELIVRRNGILGVLLVENGNAKFYPLANALEGRATLTDLPLTSVVITQGRQTISDGDAIVIADEQ